jgi:hypothetical protein
MINSVRNTVLAVLNKNNYGYISPQDFNLYAKQAQMEFFEEFFSNYNKIINMENSRMSGTDYADIEQPVAEVMESFLTSDFLVPLPTPSGYTTNQFYAPSVVTVGNDFYMINKLLCYTNFLIGGLNSGVSANQLVDATANFITAGVKSGDVIVNITTLKTAEVIAVSTTVLTLSDNIFTTSSESYGVYSASSISEGEKVSVGKITMLNNSLLTAPSLIYPSYTLTNNNIISLYPKSIGGYGAVQAFYFRYPKDPKWTYITLANGEPVFDQSQLDYQDFELPPEDEYKLAVKILQYCGVSIREDQVVQFGMAQEQHEQPSFSMQQ